MSDSLYRFETPTGLDQWPALRDFWEHFKASRHADRISVTQKELEGYYVASLAQPHMAGVLMGLQGDAIRGVIVVESRPYQRPDSGLVVPATYIAGVYVDPKVGRSFSDQFMAFLDQWSKDRRHQLLFGNGRAPKFGENNYKLEAVYDRYGFSAAHTVVVKMLEV